MVCEDQVAFILDLDGTLYLGDQVIPGACEAMAWIRQLGAQVRFVTNNPRHSSSSYINKLNDLGIQARPFEVVTSARLTAEFLSTNAEFGRVYMIGEEQLLEELDSAGVETTDQPDADTVLVSFDTTLTYQKLMVGYRALNNGARFIATNADPVCPGPHGGLMDAGGIIAALEKCTGRKLELVVGKPSKLLADLLSSQLVLPPQNCIVVGDRLNTDIRLGKRGGMKTVWIDSAGGNQAIPDNLRPDHVVASIKELPGLSPELGLAHFSTKV